MLDLFVKHVYFQTFRNLWEVVKLVFYSLRIWDPVLKLADSTVWIYRKMPGTNVLRIFVICLAGKFHENVIKLSILS